MNDAALVVMFFLIFGGGAMVTKLWESYNKTRLEMARIRAESNYATPTNRREIEELRSEMEHLRKDLQSLRDTSMQYDLSFDSALSRMESRIANVENRTSGYGSTAPETNSERSAVTYNRP